MASAHAPADRARYQPRPERPPLVAADLADLQGPTEGTAALPLRLFWSAPDRTFDLSDPAMLRSMYEKVLREAIRTDELTRFLNGGTLVAVWRDLFLPQARTAGLGRPPSRAAPRRHRRVVPVHRLTAPNFLMGDKQWMARK